MKLGFSCDVLSEAFPNLKDFGFDYCETSFAAYSGTGEDVTKRLDTIKQHGFPIPYANCALRGGIALVGENKTSSEELRTYFEDTFTNIKGVGLKMLVLGSGFGRKIPEGYDQEKAMDDFFQAVTVIGDVAQKYGTVIVIEPLCKRETNLINTVQQGADFVRALNHPNVKLLADCYHMRAESESFDVLVKNIDIIRHAHIAESAIGRYDIRRFPEKHDEFNTREFIDVLKGAGYDGNITIECGGRGGDFITELKESEITVREWMN